MVSTNVKGCQMVYFRTKNPNLGKFWRTLEWKMLVYFMVFWNILRTLGIFYAHLATLCSFGIFSPVLVYCVKKNLATLQMSQNSQREHSFSFKDSGPKFQWNSICCWSHLKTLCLRLTPSKHLFLSLSLFVSFFLCLCLSLSFPVMSCFFLSVSFSVTFFRLPVFFFFSHFLSLSLSVSFLHWLYLSISFTVFICMLLSLPSFVFVFTFICLCLILALSALRTRVAR
jgi:hypothetical protein